MRKKIALFLVCIMLGTSFLADFHSGKIEATGNLIYIDDSYNGSYVNNPAPTDYWISYNDGYADNAFGLTQDLTITMAIELTDNELASYRNYVIDKINVAFGSENNPSGQIFNYKVWIEDSLPTNPYCGCVNIVATGTSTGDVWNIIDVPNTPIPDTGNVFIGINIEQVSGKHPCGVDSHQSGPTRAALLTYQGLGSWTNLFAIGFPGVWCLNVGIFPDNPPNTPSYLKPSNHETNVDINDNLLWTCSDPDGDNLTYNIYFGTSLNPPLVSRGQSGIFYDPPIAMSYNTKYYWKIVAEDEYGVSTPGPIWDFTTVNNPNNPPYTPSNPYPENNSINITTDIVLIWSGGDPDNGDTVTYDVYFGSMPLLLKVASNISTLVYNPGTLANSLTYFWSVISWDNHNQSTAGPIWHFTTINATNNPPNKPTINGQVNGKTNKEYEYKFMSTDPEGDNITYCINWGDNTAEVCIGPYPSGAEASASHIWSEKGNYIIKAKARDAYGAESNWTILAVTMPQQKQYINQFIQQLIEKLTNCFPLLEKILNLNKN